MTSGGADKEITISWWPIETITIATARLADLNAHLASICADHVANATPADPSSTVEFATAERVLCAHAELWTEVVPESVRLENHRAPRPMPSQFGALENCSWSDLATVIAALIDATRRLANGLDNPEGRPFRRVCRVVLADLEYLGDVASGSRAGTFVDTLSVFTLD